MLSFIIWIPIATALFLFLVPIKEPKLNRWIALFSIFLVLVISIHIFRHAPALNSDYGFAVQHSWVPSLGISYHLGVDRLNSMLILLTALVGIAAIGLSHVTRNSRYFYALGLIMTGGLIGAFASLDLFFLYIFHEFALIPTFILIGFWGSDRRRQAAMKITLYLAFGSLILLIGLLGLYYFGAGEKNFSFDLLALKKQLAITPIPHDKQIWIFGILLLGFGTLISMVPFHTWAPIGYGEAPPMASMLHAGVIKKFGLYGLFAVAIPLLPEGYQYWKSAMVYLAIGNLIYGGYIAMQQKDLRYMLAYASISHMGYAFLALASGTPLAIQGFFLFLFAHGITAAIGFGIAGYCREQMGTTHFDEMGGLASKMPFAATAFTMAAFASCGLPGFANFPAELMIFFGSFATFRMATILAIWTVVITAIYQLRAVRTVFFGTMINQVSPIQDVGYSYRVIIGLLLLALLMGGFWPRFIVGQEKSNSKIILTSSHHE